MNEGDAFEDESKIFQQKWTILLGRRTAVPPYSRTAVQPYRRTAVQPFRKEDQLRRKLVWRQYV